jgi:hypothetical protein
VIGVSCSTSSGSTREDTESVGDIFLSIFTKTKDTKSFTGSVGDALMICIPNNSIGTR